MPDTLPFLLFGDWAAAFDEWLAGLERDYGHSQRQRHWRSWADFLAFCPKPPWEVTRADVEAWMDHLTSRGLAWGSIYKKLHHLSHFYDYVNDCGGAREPLAARRQATRSPAPGAVEGGGFNPVRLLGVPRKHWQTRIVTLTPEEAGLLLDVVDREDSVLGLRDYALILAHLLCGYRSGRILNLRWGELEGAGVVRSVDKARLPSPPRGRGAGGEGEQRQNMALGSQGVLVMPEEVVSAIEAYLAAAGRLEGIRPEDYIFVSPADPLRRQSLRRPEDWNLARPISANAFYKVLHACARCAGLRPELINPRALRMTAILLHVEAGDTPEELAAFTGRVSIDLVKFETRRLLTEDRPGVRLEGAPPPTRRIRRAAGPPGNLKGLKHGLYASHLPSGDFEGVDELLRDSLEEEIQVLRVCIRRTLACQKDAQTLAESCRYLELLGKAAGRLANLMKIHHELGRDD